MNKIISKTITITLDKLPPVVNFIENKIKEFNIDPLRWAVVEVDNNTITLSVSGYML